MGGDGGQDGDGPGPARRLGTALAVLLLVALAGLTVRQAGRLSASGGSGSLSVEAARDDGRGATAAEPLPPAVDGTWEMLPAAGLAARSEPIAVWTGVEVFVWGGWAREGTTRSFNDGALYEPASRTWTPVAPGPPHGWRDGAVGVWTGSEVLVLGGRNGIGRAPVAQAYHPDRAAWRELPQPPAGRWLWQTAVWTGTHVVAVEEAPRGSGVRTLLFDPVSSTWRTGPHLSPMRTTGASGAAWLDEQMVVSGQIIGGDRLMLQSFEPAGAAWRRGRGAPPEGEWLAAVTTTGAAGDVVLAGPVPGQEPRFVAARWNRHDGWRPLPDVPSSLRNARPPRLFTLPAGPVLWPDGPTPPSVLTGGTWRPLPAAPLEKRHREAVVNAGHNLFVWGGHRDQHADSGAIFRPAGVQEPRAAAGQDGVWAGSWRPLPPLPIAPSDPLLFADRGLLHVMGRDRPDGPRRVWRLEDDGWTALTATAGAEPDACAVHLDGKLLVWGRDGPAWRGTMIHLRADEATELPSPPMPPAGMTTCAAWRGQAVLVTGDGNGYRAAVLDTTTRRWRELPPPPFQDFLLRALSEGAAPDAPLLVVASTLTARYADGDWTIHDAPRNGFPTDMPAVRWTGQRLLVWGGHVERPVRDGWSLQPATGRWEPMPPPWFGGTAARPPAAWHDDRWVVWGWDEATGTQQVGAYEPITQRWHRLPATRARAPVTAALGREGIVVLHADGAVRRFTPDARR